MSLPEIISIHAPYKRVRPKYRKQVTAEAIISIHAPYKRVRPVSLQNGSMSLIFQSTHPTRECDSKKAPLAVAFYFYFNPRTLQESATVSEPVHNLLLKQFQSTHPTRECDRQLRRHRRPGRTIFQSTHPTRECDVTVLLFKTCVNNFNPRTLQESATTPPNHFGFCRIISIHAPYKRVRRILISCPFWVYKFQSTHPTRECDLN